LALGDVGAALAGVGFGSTVTALRDGAASLLGVDVIPTPLSI
jgi:hypothetical protein